jgi:hypothetical protein
VKGLLPTVRGAYWICESCGHKWQQDGLRVSWREGVFDKPGRRKGDRDRPPTAGERVEPTPCSHCGRVDEAQQRRIRQLADRVAKLEAENALLRDSSRSFGELADRLNQQLRQRPQGGNDDCHD